jgi:hypothetical protein
MKKSSFLFNSLHFSSFFFIFLILNFLIFLIFFKTSKNQIHMLKLVQAAQETNTIYPLAEKLLNARKTQTKGDPFKKDEFTSLRDIA